jgi:hypothetical protein
LYTISSTELCTQKAPAPQDPPAFAALEHSWVAAAAQQDNQERSSGEPDDTEVQVDAYPFAGAVTRGAARDV